jgi:ubiquinone/menaquinone biosynthesis C-methylase UbiE
MTPKDYYNLYAQEWITNARHPKMAEHVYIEIPAIVELLKNKIANTRILCIGCGSGDECKLFSEMGAKEIVGVDISDKLIAYDREHYPNMRFEVASWDDFNQIEDIGLFDIVYAGFSIHYVNDWTKVCNDVAKVLKSEGLFVFSTLNPIKLMLERIKEPPIKQKVFGIVRNTETKKVIRTYGEYVDSKYDLRLFNNDSVEVYKKKFSTMINELGASELRITKFLEPLPTLAGKEFDEAGHLDDLHSPPVLIGVLQKP